MKISKLDAIKTETILLIEQMDAEQVKDIHTIMLYIKTLSEAESKKFGALVRTDEFCARDFAKSLRGKANKEQSLSQEVV